MERAELSAWLRLTLTRGVGTGTARRLLAAFGLPQAVFEAPTAALQQLATPAQVAALRGAPEGLPALLEATWAWLHGRDATGAGRRFVTLGDAGYPQSLLAIEDPPLALYLLGRVDFKQDTTEAQAEPGLYAINFEAAALARAQARGIAIVGTRNPTPQGAQNARAFGRYFAEAGMSVVSGLALGIDAAAHEGALDGARGDGCATIAVLGTGLDRVYPARHRALAHRIAEQGLLLSEYPLGTPPLAANFPRRNRLIAGLSLGTLVVEAAQPSGSLITARLAVEQGKEVFAIPGSIHAPQSRGCHALIRQGAKLVESAQDVLEELRLPVAGAAPAPPAGEAPPLHADLLEALGYDPVGLDALVARTGIAAATLQAQLLELELEGHVTRLPGGLFQRMALG
ncbi:DNA-processing protein DprA [Xylophilus sp. ASV27]|uniref:DNA-processing protein DprA n=1 Tax=Xylophilus sp. ASV27 TaxID=2795129 RepID=UPI0018EB3ACC|nr:DNA-processing protein DprA [Xylophilus sp. ASV27]